MLLSQTIATPQAAQEGAHKLSVLTELHSNLHKASKLLHSLGDYGHLKFDTFRWSHCGPAELLNARLLGLIEDLESDLREWRSLLSRLRSQYYAPNIVSSVQFSSFVLSIKARKFSQIKNYMTHI